MSSGIPGIALQPCSIVFPVEPEKRVQPNSHPPIKYFLPSHRLLKASLKEKRLFIARADSFLVQKLFLGYEFMPF
jgi:hypothetical protein